MANGDDEPLSEFDRHVNDSDWYDEGQEVYETILDQMIDDFGTDTIDQYAADLMWDIWFDAETTSYDRAAMMYEFFDYTGLEWEDFNWEEWREWYES